MGREREGKKCMEITIKYIYILEAVPYACFVAMQAREG